MTGNPPLVNPLSAQAAGTAASYINIGNALGGAGGVALNPAFTDPNFLPGRMQSWNANVEREIGLFGLMVGYFGSHGDRQSIPINLNQFVTPGGTVRPFPRVSASSPIVTGCGAEQHRRARQPGMVQLQRDVGDGEPPDVARPAGVRLVHAGEVHGHELGRRDDVRAGQLQSRRQLRAVGLRRPPSGLVQRRRTICRSRATGSRTAGRSWWSSRRRPAGRSTSPPTSRRSPARRPCGRI